MEITYRLTEEDIVAFAEHYAATSRALRRTRLRNLIITVISFPVLGAILWDVTKDVGWGIGMGVTAILCLFLYPLVQKDQFRKTFLRLYREGKNLAHAKPIRMRADPEALFSESAAGSSTIRWECFERIDRTAKHIFLHTSASNALVVPQAGVIAGDFEAFADTATRLWCDAVSAANPDDPAHV